MWPSLSQRFVPVLLVLALVGAACGTSAPESLAFATEDTERTVIRLATPRIDGFESAIADWEHEHPTVEIQVVLDETDDHHQWLVEGSATPTDIDIVAFEGAFSADARTRPDVFVDLSDHVEEELEDSFIASRWREGVANGGELVGLPLDTDAQLLFFRNDLAAASVLSDVRDVQTWCEVIAAGNDFVDQTDRAFLADGEELLLAMLMQNRSSWVDSNGRVDPAALSDLQRAWDITMTAVGADTVGANPCAELTDHGPILRDLNPGESVWQAEIASDDFGAVISNWSDRALIAQAYPESVELWGSFELPVDNTFSDTSGSSSEGGLHLAIPRDSENVDIALDLILTLTNPVVQVSTFLDGQGPLPAVRAPYEDGTVESATDSFFTGSVAIGSIASDTVLDRSTEVAGPERRIVIDVFVAALASVQGQLETPEEAWETALANIEFLLFNEETSN